MYPLRTWWNAQIPEALAPRAIGWSPTSRSRRRRCRCWASHDAPTTAASQSGDEQNLEDWGVCRCGALRAAV